MLKKAGIVVATAAAGLLAVSPLAFAGDKDDHDHHRDDDGHKKVKVEKFEGTNEAESLLVARPVAVNICNNGDFGDDILGLVNLPLLSTQPTVDEDRNCYQRAENSIDAEQRVEQSNEND